MVKRFSVRLPFQAAISLLASACLVLAACNEDQDVRDNDLDGLSNAEEFALGTNINDPDSDGDGLTDFQEVRSVESNPNVADTDGDGIDDGQEVDDGTDPLVPNGSDTVAPANDDDGDGLENDVETNTGTYISSANTGSNPNNNDTDGDTLTDYAEVYVYHSDPNNTDTDNDGILDQNDNCIITGNAGQTDTDSDGRGDACDDDDDNDGMPDSWETANSLNPLIAADAGNDPDGDTIFNLDEYRYCDASAINDALNQCSGNATKRNSINPQSDDSDSDTILDQDDNCASTANTDQLDTDGDNFGDVCDADMDGDGMPNSWENTYAEAPLDELDNSDAANDPDGDNVSNQNEYLQGTDPTVQDTDEDGVNDDADNCPTIANAGQENLDGDSRGDACDSDMDGDGMPNSWEDNNGLDKADAADASSDPDGDTLNNLAEYDLDQVYGYNQHTNPQSSDTDGDGVLDQNDNCPTKANADQLNQDGDVYGDVCDSDRDGDGISNVDEYINGTDADELSGYSLSGYQIRNQGYPDEAMHGLLQHSNGQIWAVGDFGSSQPAYVRSRMGVASFGGFYVDAFTGGSGFSSAKSIVQHPAGRMFMGGVSYAGSGGESVMSALKFFPSGGIDGGFDGDGKIISDNSSGWFGHSAANDLVFDSFRNRLIIAGDLVGGGYTPDGIDSCTVAAFDGYSGGAHYSLQSGNKAHFRFGNAPTSCSAIKQVPGTSAFYLVGTTRVGSEDLYVWRITTNGAIDSANFAQLQYDLTGGDDYGRDMLVQSDGKVLVVGDGPHGNSDWFLVRLLPDGSFDSTFGNNGTVMTDFGSGDDVVTSVTQQSDGKIVVAGYSNNGSVNQVAVARYNLDGTLDASFNEDGLLTLSAGVGDSVANDVIQSQDGKLMIVGQAAVSVSDKAFLAARILQNGYLDPSFGTP